MTKQKQQALKLINGLIDEALKDNNAQLFHKLATIHQFIITTK